MSPFGGDRFNSSPKKNWARWNKISIYLKDRVKSQNGISIDQILKDLNFKKCGSSFTADIYNGAALAENLGLIKAQYGKLYLPGTQPPLIREATNKMHPANIERQAKAVEHAKRLIGTFFGVWEVLDVKRSNRKITYYCKCSNCGKKLARLNMQQEKNHSCYCQYRGKDRRKNKEWW